LRNLKFKIFIDKYFLDNERLLVSFLFVVFAAFPILPFKLKGLPVFLFILFAIYIFIKKEQNLNLNLSFLTNSLLFVLYFLSIFYSENFKSAISILETTLSILILPISFVFVSGNKKVVLLILNQENVFKKLFILFTLFLSVIVLFVSFQYRDSLLTKIELNDFLARLTEGFFWLEEHPIYLSIYISVSLLMIIDALIVANNKEKVCFIILGVLQLSILLMLSKKGIIISFFFAAIMFLLIKIKRKKRVLKFILLFSILTTAMVVLFLPNTTKRFREVFDAKSYTKIESYSSTSIRYGIYLCSFERIKESWGVGYGIGDVSNELQKCYTKTSKVLEKGNYNSHNQYLGIILSVGIIGFFIFITSIIINLKLFYSAQDYFAFCILLMFVFFMFFENILDRQNGVILFSWLLNFYTFKNINKIKTNKVLMIGPFPEPISGVSLANKVVKEVLDNSGEFTTDTVDTSYPIFQDSIGGFSLKKFLFFLVMNFKGMKVFSSDIIYITPGQTFFGITKYSFFILLASFLRKDLIIHVHGNYIGTQYQELKGLKKKLFRFLISKFTKGIVLSASLKSNLTPFLDDDKIFVLYNFAEEYLYKDTESYEKPVTLRISYLSNLMEEKGVLYLLDALKAMEVKNVPYKAKIAGNIDESLKDSIKEKIDALKYTDYLGVVYDQEKKELLGWSTIFVLPTFYKMEGQPISILEALSTENVIITTDHAGIPDIIKNKIQGYIVKPKDSASILDSFLYLNKNKVKILEVGKNNKKYFIKNFTVEIFSKEIIKIIKKSDAKTI
jgi:glycosyltransferase involved in cell wall biosynthesis/O-antigen ligase